MVLFNIITIFLFSFFLSSLTLAESNSIVSCDKTNSIFQFRASLIIQANKSGIRNINELTDYLDLQFLETNNSKDIINIKNTIRSSLTTVNNYKELSKIYIANIDKYNYYEFFTSKIYCQHVEYLELVKKSFVLAEADFLLERTLIEKLITPYNNEALLSKYTPTSDDYEEGKKRIRINKTPFILAGGALLYPHKYTVPKWGLGVNTSTYNYDIYDNVRASTDWTDLNTNLDGYNSNYDFRYEWNPVHPYETIGADDAYAYGYTGQGQVIAIHDSEFCTVPHRDVKNKFNEGRITSYNWENWNWCGESYYHGVSVFGFAAAEFNNNPAHENDLMGVAYNADLHLSDYWGSGGTNWEPTVWADNLNHAKKSGAVVQNNSWGFDDDLNPDLVKNYMDDNNKTLAEALVYYQGIKTEGLTGSDTVYDIGISTSQQNWVVDDWNTFFNSINSFQETGVYVNAGSNDNYGNMGAVNCTADIDGNKQCHSNPTKTIDTSGGLPYLLPSLRDAWIQVVNVLNYGFTDDNIRGQQIWSAPCAQMAEWCVSGDAVHVPALSYRTDANDTDSRYLLEGYGTSYAAPMISGAVAIMAEAFPTLSPSDWTQRLFATANNSWFNNTNCFDWSKVTNTSLITKNDVGKDQANNDYWTASCGGIDAYAHYGNGIKHGYNEIYGHGYPDLKKALEPIEYNRIRVGNSYYTLAASTIFLSALTHQNLDFSRVVGQSHDALYTGFNFKMDNLVKHPIRNYSRNLNSFDSYSSRKLWIDSIGTEKNNLEYAISYTDSEEELDLDTTMASPEIAKLSYEINHDINTSTNFSYKESSNSLLGFDIGERPLQNFLSNGLQQDYLPFTAAMNSGYSVGQHHLLNNQDKLSYNFYQGEHSYTKKIESGFLFNFSNFNLEDEFYLNAYTGYNAEDDSFLRNQTSGAFGETNANTFHTGFTYEDNITNNLYFGSNLNLGYTTTKVSEETLISSVDPLFTSQYIIGLVEKNIINENDSLSFNLSQPLSVESGKATFKIPYYLNKSSNGFNEKEIDMSVKDRFNKLNLDYVYNFSDYSQLHTGITIGMINFNALDDSSFMINYKLSF